MSRHAPTVEAGIGTGLRAATAPVDLPVDRPRSAEPTYEAARTTLRLDAGLTRAVRAWAERHQTDPFDVLLAAFVGVLTRHAGQPELTVGTTAATTREPAVDGAVTEPLLLTVATTDDPTFRDLAGRVRRARLDAPRGEADRPLPASVAFRPALAPAPGPAPAPAPARGPGTGVAGPPVERAVAGSGAPRHELEVDARIAADVVLDVRYETGLFDRQTIERLLGHVRTLLAAAVNDDDATPLSGLALLTQTEQRRMLVDWNDTAAPLDHATTLHGHFAARAAATPGAPALLDSHRPLSFHEADTAANRLAHHLRAHGVGPGVRVGLSVDRGPDLLVAILGVLKAGGAYLPLDPDYPAERLDFMQRDAETAVLVTQSRLLGRLSAPPGPVVLLDRDADAIAARPDHPPPDGAGPDDLCYVIYTSGSTGRPKGIALRHRGVVNNLLDLNARFAIGPGDRVLALSSTSFDMSVYELLGITLAGGAVVIADAARLRDPAHWAELIGRHAVTVWNSAPALLELLVAHLERTGGALSGLRLAMLGGDWVAVTLPDRLRIYAAGVRVIVLGGATEASIHSTLFEAGSPLPGWNSIPYGRPMANQRAYILDAARQPVPVGVPGELHLAGVGLAEGYLGRPDLTAERFVTWSHGPVRGERLYRTGDLARFRPDGLIELLGRIDFQVKVRGLRVELGEIESTLRAQPGVAEAVVIARKGGAGDGQLVGYLESDGGHLDIDTIRAGISATLPAYMVPPSLIELARLPLTPNGKLDRAQLAGLAALPRARAVEGTKPTDSVAQALAEIWRELLGVDEIVVQDRFTDLGGDSLKAMQVVSRLREALDVEVALSDLLAADSLASTAARVREARARRSLPDAPIMPREHDGPVPLSLAQERLWYLDRLKPGAAVYNVAVAVPWYEDLDHGALERSLNRLVARHEALRTRFAVVAGEPRQVVDPPWRLAVDVHDILEGDPAAREAAVAACVRAEAGTSFDLTRGRLLRARLVRPAGGPQTLLLTTHHIVSDGWSLDVLLTELEQHYRAELEGQPLTLPEPPVQYADYALWQRERLQGETADAAYWRDRLAGAPPVLELPGDRLRPPVQTFRGGLHRFQFSETLRHRLAELSRRHGVTDFMTLLAGFTALLHRYTGQTDVVVGTPVANRTRRELEPLVGFFVNTLALRVDLAGDPGFDALLARVQGAALAAYEHQEMPFERVVDEVAPERDPAHMPVVQVIFQLNDVAMRPLHLSGRSLQPRLLDTGTAKCDLAVTLEPCAHGLAGLCEYNGDIFDEATVARLADHLRVLLEAAVQRPDLRLSQLPLLRADDRRRLLHEANRTATPLPDGACVHELFEEQADRCPDAPAVTYGGARLSYAELEAKANRLDRYLRRLGVGPGTRVGICMGRSPELVVGLLGILKAGAAYVPLDPDYPADRLAFMVADAGLDVLVTQQRTRGRVALSGLREICLDHDADAVATESAQRSPGRAAAGDVAYVLYTSGSTGRPKGIMVTHRSIVRLVRNTNYISLAGGDRVAAASSPSFDASTFEVWGALANGAGLVIVPKEVVLSPDELARTIRDEGITSMFLTTAAVNAVARERPDAFGPLQTLLFGGEAAEPRWVREILERGAPQRLVNVYGPTETTTFATWFEVEAVPDTATGVPIGRCVSNTESYVLDAGMAPVPVGFVGELYLGGPGLATGYLGQPALTAERFVPDPFSGRAGDRLYRTGDLVKLRPDGAMEFVGRNDAQVKIRGFRVELGEIETALLTHPAIADAAVTVAGEHDDKRLAAFIVSRAPVAVSELRAFLRRRLPEYMVPSAFATLDALPLSPSGKVDRRALHLAEQIVPEPVATPAAPRSPVEEVLIGIWADLLGAEQVGIDDDFFALGGHSLLAVRLISRVNAALGTNLPLAALMTSTSPRALAAEVAAAKLAGGRATEPALRHEARRGPVALASAQQRLWFMDQLEPGSSFYNVPIVLRMRGTLDRAALGQALDGLVGRHESLRTTFPAPGGRPHQVVAPAAGVPLEYIDLTADPDAAATAARTAAAEAERPFDLVAGPLLRATLIGLRPDRHWLLVTFHHIVIDGWSLDVVMRELSALYGAAVAGRADPLPDVALQYADYAVWQREWLQSESLDEMARYWRDVLGPDPAVLELPTDRPRPAQRRFRGAIATRTLEPALIRGARELSRREGATLYMTLVASFQALLGGWTGATDITVGTPVAGRTRPELHDMIGCLINVVPLRADLTGAADFRELLARVRQACLGAFAHQDIPFDKLVEALVSRRSRDFMPLFRVMFSFVEDKPAPVMTGLDECELELAWPQDTAKFDLILTVDERPDGASATLQYDSDLFEPTTAAALLAAYERLLAQVVDAPQQPIPGLAARLLGALGIGGSRHVAR